MINEKIQINFKSNQIYYEQQPQPLIKFDTDIGYNNPSLYAENIHIVLNGIFIDFFNNYDIIKLIRNKIYTEVFDEEIKRLLNKALSEIQLGNSTFLGLLFNVTILENNIYVYL